MTSTTFFWHDYETFGADPQRDRPCQFAGVRTDTDFNLVGDPIMLYCRPADDYLPHPEACLITGITPQLAAAQGVCEAAFAETIHGALSQPGTCGVGYNSIRFDDEVTRNLLYRNFFDPYAREWQNGNSRWDLIDVVRAARALRPEGIEWPDKEDGLPSFRLEDLTQANGLLHDAAHDALSDVYATIAIAKLVKQKQPKLFEYLINHRHKSQVSNLLRLGSFTPLLHISGRLPSRNHCLAVVLPLAQHPTNSNEVIVYDLAADPEPLFALSAEEIKQRLFVANADLPEGTVRIPLKTVHINKCPVLAPISVLKPADRERLQLDLAVHDRHLKQIQAAPALDAKLAEVFSRRNDDTKTSDPDLMIYSGGFFSQRDKSLCQRLRQTAPASLADFESEFEDLRLPEMLFRYRARNYPDTLNQEERRQWSAFCRDRLERESAGYMGLAQFREKINALRADSGQNHTLLDALENYADQLAAKHHV
ncbi:exodeoxyribonuclease I [Methylomonas sp. HW2-6]|uniref:exodeoxyribonuclease I n=1 Tax=Methylomonas sp. HW2-6 TaxID=3376687 RepID=UPI00404200F1